MTPKGLKTMRQTLLTFAVAFSVLNLSSAAQTQPDAVAPAKSISQMTFSTPEAAVEKLIKATGDYDVPTLMQIFGPSGEDFISSADPVRDKSASIAFADLARTKNSLQTDPAKKDRVTLIVGDDDYPFPVPLVKKGGKWHFDTAAGKTEILYRRIGANELDAIQVCRGYVDAQHQYAA